jgi:hypothetical protein
MEIIVIKLYELQFERGFDNVPVIVHIFNNILAKIGRGVKRLRKSLT